MREGLAGDIEDYTKYVPSAYIAAAHELKSPLAALRQLALEMQLHDTQSTDIGLLSSQMIATSDRMLRLVQALTASEKIEQKLFELEPINPLAVCEDVAHELYPLYKAHGRELRVEHRMRTPLVMGNRDLLHRILAQFTDNALKYADALRPIELRAHASSMSGKVRVSVRDFGPSAQAVAKGTTLHPYRPESSGLGLAITRQFAQCMNSNVGVLHHRDGASYYVDVNESVQLALV